ncbi:hypothetical protein [Leifsonia sp. NPDC077715]|uniref:hypothetical protein n=1 Tax=Leifsonia sp. NPDC077715 TaxID=3155539 RepID=UPI003436E8DA
MFEMDKCRDEFEDWFKTTQYFFEYFTDSDLNLNHRNEYENEIINSAWLTFQHQQAKVEELEGKLKQAYEDVDTFAEAHERECGFKAQLAKDKAELQKRVDAVKQLIQDYLDEEKELELKEWEQSTIYGRIAIELEQALKGEG